MKKLEKLDRETNEILRQTFYETKKTLDPLMNHLKFSDLSIRWWIKPAREHGFTAGQCFKGNWIIRTKSVSGRKMKSHFNNLILLAKDYYQSNGLEEIKKVFKHELLHLIAKDTHGSNFKHLAVACDTHRYCPARIIK